MPEELHEESNHETKEPAGAAKLEDVAARVGISRSEVSRVLNGRVRAGRGVGEETRRRILAAAQEMNYRPHRAAQNLARGRTDTAALMMMTIDPPGQNPSAPDYDLPPHYHAIIGALAHTFNLYGINLLLTQCGSSHEDPVKAMDRIARSHICDGMILTDLYVTDPRLQVLTAAGLPYVVRGSSPQTGVAAVGMDNSRVAYEAVEYLAKLGHRKILFYNMGRDLMSGQRRYEGFCRARAEFGLAETLDYCDTAHYENGIYQDMTRRLAAGETMTAVFAEDEIGALGAIRALEEFGLSVPGDVSVMTCLNARFMRRVAPHLSVMNVRQEEVASEAAHLLSRILRGEELVPEQVFLAPFLEERGSTAPPPSLRRH